MYFTLWMTVCVCGVCVCVCERVRARVCVWMCECVNVWMCMTACLCIFVSLYKQNQKVCSERPHPPSPSAGKPYLLMICICNRVVIGNTICIVLSMSLPARSRASFSCWRFSGTLKAFRMSRSATRECKFSAFISQAIESHANVSKHIKCNNNTLILGFFSWYKLNIYLVNTANTNMHNSYITFVTIFYSRDQRCRGFSHS